MKNTIASAGLIQHVQGPTHNLGNTVDLVFTRDDSVTLGCNTVETCISDHYMICFSLAKHKPDPIFITSALRNYRKIDKLQPSQHGFWKRSSIMYFSFHFISFHLFPH